MVLLLLNLQIARTSTAESSTWGLHCVDVAQPIDAQFLEQHRLGERDRMVPINRHPQQTHAHTHTPTSPTVRCKSTHMCDSSVCEDRDSYHLPHCHKDLRPGRWICMHKRKLHCMMASPATYANAQPSDRQEAKGNEWCELFFI